MNGAAAANPSPTTNPVRVTASLTDWAAVGTLPYRHDGAAGAVLEGLTARGIAAGVSNFYAYRLVQALGLDPETGVLRLSFVHYTAPEEIGRLIKALDASL